MSRHPLRCVQPLYYNTYGWEHSVTCFLLGRACWTADQIRGQHFSFLNLGSIYGHGKLPISHVFNSLIVAVAVQLTSGLPLRNPEQCGSKDARPGLHCVPNWAVRTKGPGTGIRTQSSHTRTPCKHTRHHEAPSLA
jgi:hypothetical protein